MVFWIICLAVIALACYVGWAVSDYHGIGEGVAAFLITFLIGGFVGGLIWGAVMSANRDSADRVEVNREAFTVAEKSDFEAEDGIVEFVAEVDGKLVSKTFHPSDIHWETKNVKEVEVVVTDLVHNGMSPWVIHTETEVYIR